MCVEHAVKVMEATESKVVLAQPHPSQRECPLNSGRRRSESRTRVMEDAAN